MIKMIYRSIIITNLNNNNLITIQVLLNPVSPLYIYIYNNQKLIIIELFQIITAKTNELTRNLI